MSKLELKIGEKTYDVTPPFTNRELHLIKQIAGVRAGEIEEALNAEDNDVLVALAHIGVRRNNTARPSLDELWDMEAGAISFEETGVEPDPTPAASAAEVDGSLETIPPGSGVPSSDESSTSALVTSGT